MRLAHAARFSAFMSAGAGAAGVSALSFIFSALAFSLVAIIIYLPFSMLSPYLVRNAVAL
jgi:hypothetical protein